MASVANDPGGRRRVLYFNAQGKRKTLRLGVMSRRAAETVASHIELIVGSQKSGTPIPPATNQWLTAIEDELREKLAGHGLVEKARQASLGGLLADFIEKRRTTVKNSTLLVWQQAERNLRGFFGPDRRLRDIGPGDAEDFRSYLIGTEGLSESTARKRCAVASMMFRYATKHGLITVNPFDEVPKANMATRRRAFIDPHAAGRVLAELPNAQWRLLFGLSRWAGLRVGSEVRLLTWGDIDWERRRFTVRSPKTERYAGHGSRVVPIFPELAPLLEECFAQAAEGETLVLPFLRGRSDASLRGPLTRAINRAGVEEWPRMWHNLRSSRQTELEDRFPTHTVCSWLGNNESTARKHYLQVLDRHFDEAAQNAAQSAPVSSGNDPPARQEPRRNHRLLPTLTIADDSERMFKVVREGLENTPGTSEKQASGDKGGAECGALRAGSSDFAPSPAAELARVINRWPTLPESVRAAVLRLVDGDA